MSLIGTLHSASSGMKVSQLSINVASHNITNINTPGYVRQRVEQSAGRPLGQQGLGLYLPGPGHQGTGVKANDIVRIKNSFYDYQFRSENPSYGNTVVKYNYYRDMETAFNEPSDNGLSSALNGFYNSWNELSKDPNSSSAKHIAIENSKYLAGNITTLYKRLDSLSSSAVKDRTDLLTTINDEVKQIQDLMLQITISTNAGNTPNDLMDKRDMLIDSLSGKIDLKHPDLEIALADGELTLDEAKSMGIDGSLKGILDMEEEIANYKEDVGILIESIATTVNTVYKDGLSGTDVKDFFEVTYDANGVAMGLSVNKEFLDDSDALKMTTDKALALKELKDTKFTIDGKDVSVSNYYANMVQDLGHSTQNIKKLEDNQSKLLNNINSARWNIAGVSQDEEMVSLIQFQHAYKASAKVVSIVDSLLDVVVNGLIR